MQVPLTTLTLFRQPYCLCNLNQIAFYSILPRYTSFLYLLVHRRVGRGLQGKNGVWRDGNRVSADQVAHIDDVLFSFRRRRTWLSRQWIGNAHGNDHVALMWKRKTGIAI